MADQQLTAKRDGHVLDFIRGADTGGDRSVRSTEGHSHGRGVGSLDLVGLGGDDRVVALVSGQDRGRDRFVGSVGGPA